jgi:hypothetical protein
MSEYEAQQIQKIQAPTLVLHARDDTLVSFEQGEYTAQKIPGAQFIPMEKGGHLALMFNMNAGAREKLWSFWHSITVDKRRRYFMWILMLVLLLLGAQLNLTALVPLQPGSPPPPWWVGGMLLWPFAVETRTLVPKGDVLNTLTPILAGASATLFLLAVAALLRWVVPGEWFRWLIVAGAVLSIALQVIWLSGWAVLPLLVDLALLWAVFGQHVTVASLRG